MLITRVVSSVQEMYPCLPPRRLGVGGVNDLVTFPICRARPPPNPPERLPQTLPPETFIFSFASLPREPILREMSPVLYRLLATTLSLSETTPGPGPLNYRTRLHGRSHMYLAKEFQYSHTLSLLCTMGWDHCYCTSVYLNKPPGVRLQKSEPTPAHEVMLN